MSVPTPPALDLTLAAHFVPVASGSDSSAASSAGRASSSGPFEPATAAEVAAVGSGGSAAGEAGTAASSGSIEVALIEPANGMVAGVVSVSVPEEIASSGEGFSFPLPPELREAAALGRAHVTWRGKPLPGWLQYEKATRTFTATTLPAGALRIELSIQIGERSWTMTIAQR